jgi:hypothetical protein
MFWGRLTARVCAASPRVFFPSGVCPFGVLRSTLIRAGGRDWAPSRRSPGTRQRHFYGTSFKPHKLPDCPQGVRTLRTSSPTTITPARCQCDPGALCRRSGAYLIPVIVRDAVLARSFFHGVATIMNSKGSSSPGP